LINSLSICRIIADYVQLCLDVQFSFSVDKLIASGHTIIIKPEMIIVTLAGAGLIGPQYDRGGGGVGPISEHSVVAVK
jgi:hypothetical protein